jgi:hypothetical protein
VSQRILEDVKFFTYKQQTLGARLEGGLWQPENVHADLPLSRLGMLLLMALALSLYRNMDAVSLKIILIVGINVWFHSLFFFFYFFIIFQISRGRC